MSVEYWCKNKKFDLKFDLKNECLVLKMYLNITCCNMGQVVLIFSMQKLTK